MAATAAGGARQGGDAGVPHRSRDAGLLPGLGRIDPIDPQAPPVLFEVNLPVEWNGRALQYGGGRIQRRADHGAGPAPAMPFDARRRWRAVSSPTAQIPATKSKAGEPPQLFALNDEAFLNFSHVAYKKTHDATLALIKLAYGQAPDKVYFMGSSEGGREALTMAQRYPEDFDGIFARVPVIGWTGLQHAGTRDGLATMGPGWLGPARSNSSPTRSPLNAAPPTASCRHFGMQGQVRSCETRLPRGGGGECLRRADRAVKRCIRLIDSRFRSPTA